MRTRLWRADQRRSGGARVFRPPPLAGHLFRYSLAVAGPVGSAGAQFLLSLVLLKTVDQGAFGRFSFLLVASQFSWGVWTALFCAPLPILLASHDARTGARLVRCLLVANLLGAAIAFLLFLGIGLALGESAPAAMLFAGYAAVALVRWFARAYAYAAGRPLRTTASDVVYAGVLLAGMASFRLARGAAPELASGALLAGAIAGLLPFGPAYLRHQFMRGSFAHLARYPEVWRAHAGWSLLGVLTTEATANAHAYLVTLIRGPTAFATVAASALLIRPITVAMNALTEYERAQMARQLGAGRTDLAMRSVRFFRFVLAAAWLATAAAVAVLLWRAPWLIFPARYDRRFLMIGAGLWMLVGAVRALRTPESALMQAGGAFRALAMASIVSCGVSVAAVLALLLLSGPLWSILGILFGESVFAGVIWLQAARWLKTRRGVAMPAPSEEPGLDGIAPVIREEEAATW